MSVHLGPWTWTDAGCSKSKTMEVEGVTELYGGCMRYSNFMWLGEGWGDTRPYWSAEGGLVASEAAKTLDRISDV